MSTNAGIRSTNCQVHCMRTFSTLGVLTLLLLVNACNSSSTVASSSVTGLDPVVRASDYVLFDEGAASLSELLTYRMPGVGGSVVEARAVVLIPLGPAPEGGFPVVAWGHGTTGVADRCAPSTTTDLAGYDSYLDLYLQNGYAVVAPDYEGLGVGGSHPYLHLASEGRSLIYAVNAAAKQYANLSSRYVAVGHSQGGHAALGAGEYAREVDDVTLVGVIAIAPASNLRAQSEKISAVINDESTSSALRAEAATIKLLYSALVLSGVSAANPDFDSSVAYGSNGSTLRDSLNTQCVGGISNQLLSTVTEELFTFNSVDNIIKFDVIDMPEVDRYVRLNEPGFRATSVPVMLLQGLLDETVLPESTSALKKQLMQVNANSPTLIEYPTADHGSIVAMSAVAVLDFLDAKF